MCLPICSYHHMSKRSAVYSYRVSIFRFKKGYPSFDPPHNLWFYPAKGDPVLGVSYYYQAKAKEERRVRAQEMKGRHSISIPSVQTAQYTIWSTTAHTSTLTGDWFQTTISEERVELLKLQEQVHNQVNIICRLFIVVKKFSSRFFKKSSTNRPILATS